MIKHTLTAVTLVAALAVPAFAQKPTTTGTDNTAHSSSMPAQTNIGALKAGFVQKQSENEWRGSKLIGANVYGPGNKSVGKISDVIIGTDGRIKAAVIGVGGILGVGEKDVAVPFQALNVNRKPNSSSIGKITVSYTTDQLKNARKFAYYHASGNAETTGSSGAGSTGYPTNSTDKMKK
jgi:sporulation protein YlmC with PRC-barrel domain